MAKKRTRGRKRVVTVEREPNGRIQRPSAAKRAEQARQPVVEARQRVFGLTANQAREEEAASVLGRLSQSGELHPNRRAARSLYEAGRHYLEVKRGYLWAINAKRELAGGDFDRGDPGHDNEDGTDPAYVAKCERLIAAWQEVRREVLEADPLAMMACECVIVDDRYAPSLYGPLRCGLNAISRMLRRQGLAA